MEEPDHIGTAAFLLAAFLLIDRAPGRAFHGAAAGPHLVGRPGRRRHRPVSRGARDPDRDRVPHRGLKAHGLRYGIAGYWDASPVTLESRDQVQVRAVIRKAGADHAYNWETDLGWYAPSQHDATFVIADPPHAWPTEDYTAAQFEHYFGHPVTTHRVAGRTILIYRANLLDRVGPPAR